MTIIEYLRGKKLGEKSLDPVLDVISGAYKDLANENYKLVINEDDGEILVKIPSLKKKDEYELTKLEEYEYPLIMCMKIDDIYKAQHHQYITKSFFSIYNEDVNRICKDVFLIEELKEKVKRLKKNIEYIIYIAIGGIIALAIFLMLRNSLSSFVKGMTAASIVFLFILSIYEQWTKDSQVKSLIDGYINEIQTDWYKSDLKKHYAFLCNIM